MSKQRSYAEKLLDPRWQRLKGNIYRRDNFRCVKCGNGELTIHVHHLRYPESGNPWDAPPEWLETLCERHHCEAHGIPYKPALFLEREPIIFVIPWQSTPLPLTTCCVCHRQICGEEIEGRFGKNEPICGECCMEMEVALYA